LQEVRRYLSGSDKHVVTESAMPRPMSDDPVKVAAALRNRKYRSKLKRIRKPEAPQVDAAISAALSVAVGRLRRDGKSDGVLEALIADAKKVLVSAEYDKREATLKLMSRILYRDGLDDLDRITTNPRAGHSSPHYFVGKNRRFDDFCSDAPDKGDDT
jgi:hypothetical protein